MALPESGDCPPLDKDWSVPQLFWYSVPQHRTELKHPLSHWQFLIISLLICIRALMHVCTHTQTLPSSFFWEPQLVLPELHTAPGSTQTHTSTLLSVSLKTLDLLRSVGSDTTLHLQAMWSQVEICTLPGLACAHSPYSNARKLPHVHTCMPCLLVHEHTHTLSCIHLRTLQGYHLTFQMCVLRNPTRSTYHQDREPSVCSDILLFP